MRQQKDRSIIKQPSTAAAAVSSRTMTLSPLNLGAYMVTKNVFIIVSISALIAFLGYLSYHSRNASCDDRESLIVGTNATYPPFTFVENGIVVGYDIDIAREVARRLNKPIIIKDLSFDALIPELQLGSLHFIAADITETPQRAKQALFSRSYFSDPLVIISLADAPIRSVEELRGKEVIVNQGYYSDIFASSLENIKILRLETLSEAVLSLQTKRGDALLTGSVSAKLLTQKTSNAALNVSTIPGVAEHYTLAISKEHPDLLNCIDKAMDAMHQDGTITQLKKKWEIND